MTIETKRVYFQRLALVLLFSWLCNPTLIEAAPPYKTTDADTADPNTVEVRVGFIQAEWKNGENEYLSPLLRTNLGLPNKIELVSEFEYLTQENEFGGGALGVKWIPVFGGFSFGIETLALLPVRPNDKGVGVESQFLATWRNTNSRVHVNAGGFHDPRPHETENGWKASVLTEMTSSQFRPGIELVTKQKNGEGIDVRIGAGFIRAIGNYEVRSGIHFGLSHEAPDVAINLWISTKLPF